MRTVPILIAALVSVGCASHPALPLQASPESPCVPFGGMSPRQKWLTGDYRVVPVATEHQAQVMEDVKRGAADEVNEVVAKTVTGNPNLPSTAHYYLVRVGYVGDAPSGTVPIGVSMSVDVDTEGVAYVSSFVLSHARGTSEIAAILASPTPIKRVQSSCGAAE